MQFRRDLQSKGLLAYAAVELFIGDSTCLTPRCRLQAACRKHLEKTPPQPQHSKFIVAEEDKSAASMLRKIE
jgi:hypothetical protein